MQGNPSEKQGKATRETGKQGKQTPDAPGGAPDTEKQGKQEMQGNPNEKQGKATQQTGKQGKLSLAAPGLRKQEKSDSKRSHLERPECVFLVFLFPGLLFPVFRLVFPAFPVFP